MRAFKKKKFYFVNQYRKCCLNMFFMFVFLL